MKKSFIYGLSGLVLACCLLAPGVWWGDALNAYIQGIIGHYSAGQPVLLALLCSLTAHIMPGSLPVFIICTTLYFMGFALMIFSNIRHRIWGPVLFFGLSFYPLLFANIGVVQTEALQMGILPLFVALTILLYRYEGRGRLLYFGALVFCLCVFYLARYDALWVAGILGYWLAYSYLRAHSRRTIYTAVFILLLFYISGSALDRVAGINQGLKSQMRVSLFVADIAAISAESDTNYIPDYCWKPILPADERTVSKIQYGMRSYWRSSFYSYVYNIDPSVGLFTYDISQHHAEIMRQWIAVVCRHPLMYVKYHLMVFGYLLSGDNYDMGLWSGLILSHQNNSKLVIADTEAVRDFITKYKGRYSYRDGALIYDKDDKPISADEEQDLRMLVEPRRYSDVSWMKWYSQIPSKTYHNTNPIAEGYVLPMLDLFKVYFGWASCLFIYFCLLLFLLLFCREKIVDSYYRFSFAMLCLAGIVHLVLRIFIITDPVFRFGVISVLLLFGAIVILIADRLKNDPGYLPIRALICVISIEVAYIIYLLFSQFYFMLLYPCRIIYAEKAIFYNTIEATKYSMPQVYRMHTILLYILAIYGLVVIIRRYLVPALQRLIKRINGSL